MTDPLAVRFDALLEPGPVPDWLDVRRRARRSRRPLVLAVAALVLFVAVPAVAIAVRSGVLSWSDARPAPPAVVERFSALDRAMDAAALSRMRSQAPPDLGILADQARIVPLAGATVAYVAPGRSGGYWALLENPSDPIGAIDYRLYPSDRPGVASGSHGLVGAGYVYVHGHVIAPPGSSVEVELDDGTTVAAPVTWVGPPIDAGLFFVRLARGRRPDAVVLRAADGSEIGRDGHLGAQYEQMEELVKKAKHGELPATPGADSPRPGGLVVPTG